jgi:chemotaxis protein MotB
MAGHGRRRRGGAVEHENEERWLLTYADMLTLLFALFMVLFSISSVNISKYQVLQESLKAAFSGSVLSGGKAILRTGSQSTTAHTPATAEIPSIVPLSPTPAAHSNSSTSSATGGVPSLSQAAQAAQAAQASQATQMSSAQLQAALDSMSASLAEQSEFGALARKINAYARAHGFSSQVQAVIQRRGLVVRVLTDKLLFDSGEATLQAPGKPLLDEVAQLLNVDRTHPITVEGHTDNIPIATAEFPSNWELSTSRATNVVRYLIGRGVDRHRLSAAGYADLEPVASNATVEGRALNRRVDIVLDRINPAPPTGN